MKKSPPFSEDHNELKFSREQGFFDRSRVIQFLIALLFVLSLGLMLHFREVRVEVLELDALAPRHVVAQVDFEFFDQEATIILRQEAVRGIGIIARIEEKSLEEQRKEFEEFLVSSETWRGVEGMTFDQMYEWGEVLSEILSELRFVDPRTFQRIEKEGLNTETYALFAPPALDHPLVLPTNTWLLVQKRASELGFSGQKDISRVFDYFREKKWKLVEDLASGRALKRQIQEGVENHYTKVRSGSRIIDQGGKVTTRHLTILQAMKKALNEQRKLFSPSTIAGSFSLALLITFLSSYFLQVNYPELVCSNRKLFLIVTVMVLTFGFAKATEFFLLTTNLNVTDAIRYPIFVPFSAILLCSLMSFSIATFASGFLTMVLMICLSFEGREFVITNFSAALIAILSTRTLRQRREIFIVCGKSWICCSLIIFSIHLYQNVLDRGVLVDISTSGGFLLITAVAVVGILPLLESTFGVMTDVSLMEYMDPNHDLLRRLSIEAPGTYQHSVVVGNLAETAALAIGANGLFCRVATLYHDIGKILTPQYFTENQQGGMNIHQLLTPQESAQVIIAHVAEGVTLARKAGLPEQFIDIIKEHHGTTLVYYFYRKQLEKVGGDVSAVDKGEFRYSGVIPRTKESGIIMIVDSLEAASRSLDEITFESVSDLVDQIIKEKTEEGQFDHCLLTLEELAVMKDVLSKTVVAYGHSRMKYPKREVGEETLKNGLPV